MRSAVISAGGGRVLIAPGSLVPPHLHRGMRGSISLARLFGDAEAVAQLRRIWTGLEFTGNHHAPPAMMRQEMERAVNTHRVVLFWLPHPGSSRIELPSGAAWEPKRPIPASSPRHDGGSPTPAAPSKPTIDRMTAAEKIGLALERSLSYAAGDAKVGILAFRGAMAALTPEDAAKFIAVMVVLAIPVVGEAATMVLLGIAAYELGFQGTRAVMLLIGACFDAAGAETEADITKAARGFAEALKSIGKVLVAWIMLRVGMRSVRGATAQPASSALPAPSAVTSRVASTAAEGATLPSQEYLASRAMASASKEYKGSTAVGHAFTKHAQRHPETWGKLTGTAKMWTEQGEKHLKEIFEGEGEFAYRRYDNGLTFIEKRLADGRGARLNMDGTFKGFLD